MELKGNTDHYLTAIEPERSHKTIRWHRDKLGRWVAFLGSRFQVFDTKDLQPEHLSLFFVYLKDGRGCKSETRRGYFTVVQKYLRWLEAAPGHAGIAERLLGNIACPQISKGIVQALMKEEIARLLSTVTNKRDHAIITTFLTTGIRAGELSNLQVNDVNFAAGYIIIRRAAFGRVDGAKNDRERYVALPKSLRSTLANYLGRVRPRYPDDETPWLFLTRDGRSFSTEGLYRLVRRWLERAGIEKEQMGPHLLRRTFASQARALGTQHADLAELLGHSEKTGTTVVRRSYVTQEANLEALRHAPDILKPGKDTANHRRNRR